MTFGEKIIESLEQFAKDLEEGKPLQVSKVVLHEDKVKIDKEGMLVKNSGRILMDCRRCGSEIPQERMEALPETRLCVRCSDEIGGDFEVKVVEENMGNSIISAPIITKRLKEIEPIF